MRLSSLFLIPRLRFGVPIVVINGVFGVLGVRDKSNLSFDVARRCAAGDMLNSLSRDDPV